MRVLVIGAGEVGASIATSLADDHEVVVIDRDGARVDALATSADVLGIAGDGTALSTLESAAIEDASMVIASTDDDETNLVACKTAAVLGDAFTIARVRDRTFLETWQHSRRAFDVDFMVCTNLLAAETVVRIAGLPAARDVDLFAGGRIQMAEFVVSPDSPVANLTVREADQFDDLTFAGVIDGDDVIVPGGETVLAAGVKLIVIGTPESVRAFSATVATESDQARDVVVIGGGAVGSETARQLGESGLRPTVIDAQEARARELAERLPTATVLHHDATDVEFLLREHVDKADLVVVALDSDERTLLVSLLARQIGSRRTVAVVETAEYVQLFEAVGVDVAINPRELTAEAITRFTRDRRTENVALIETDRAEVLEIRIDEGSVLLDRPIGDAVAELPNGFVIGAITREGAYVSPRGDTVIREGDHVVVFVQASARDEILDAI